MRITVPNSVQYVSAARWDLNDIADAELHVFVDADAQKRVQRLYWIQFEAYLPSNTHRYNYKFTESGKARWEELEPELIKRALENIRTARVPGR